MSIPSPQHFDDFFLKTKDYAAKILKKIFLEKMDAYLLDMHHRLASKEMNVIEMVAVLWIGLGRGSDRNTSILERRILER